MWSDSGGSEKENICRHCYKLISQNREKEKEIINIVTAGLLIIGTKPGGVVVPVREKMRSNQHSRLLAETQQSA